MDPEPVEPAHHRSPLAAVVLVVCLLCPWQIYLPGLLGASVSLVEILVAGSALLVMLLWALSPREKSIPLSNPILLLSTLAILCLVGVAWSPDPGLGIRTSAKIGSIVVFAVAVAQVGERTRNLAVRFLGFSAVLLALMVIVFRISPLIEFGFLHSRPAELTIDPDVLAQLRTGSFRANVLAPDRAGGVFSNANGASLFFGLVLFILNAAPRPGRLRTLSSLVLVAGVLATGSKAGLAALLVTAVLWFFLVTMREGLTTTRAALLVAAASLAVFTLFVSVTRLGLGGTAAGSFESRTAIWSVAVPVLVDHPLLGLGFGGWELWAEANLRQQGLSLIYPPHNILLIAWAWIGVLGAVVVAAFLGSTLGDAVRVVRSAGAEDGRRRVGAALLLAFLWFTLQSMFTNAAATNMVIGIPLAVALAILASAGDTRSFRRSAPGGGT